MVRLALKALPRGPAHAHNATGYNSGSSLATESRLTQCANQPLSAHNAFGQGAKHIALTRVLVAIPRRHVDDVTGSRPISIPKAREGTHGWHSDQGREDAGTPRPIPGQVNSEALPLESRSEELLRKELELSESGVVLSEGLLDPQATHGYNQLLVNQLQEAPMLPAGSGGGDQQPGNYLVVAVVVIGAAAGISLAAITGQSYFIVGGLAAGALIAFWLGRRTQP